MKKSQIWIETVIYTLIGLSIIGIVLGIVKPAIEERRDSIAVKQSIDLLNSIDSQLSELKYAGAGNSRPLSLKISRGKFYLNGVEDKIEIVIENSKLEYSEPGSSVSAGGNIKAFTEKKNSLYSINLSIDYSSKLNLTYNGKDIVQVFDIAPVAYSLYVKNNGFSGDYQNIDFS